MKKAEHSVEQLTEQRVITTLEVVVFPRCVCGAVQPLHIPDLPEGCSEYRPITPIRDYGVVARREEVK